MIGVLLALAQASSPVETFTVDGVERRAVVVRGQGTPPKSGRPLVLVFHGHGGTMRYAERKHDVHSLWPEATVVYPEGLPSKGITDSEGTRNGWQQRPGAGGDRDLKFVDAILATTKGCDPKRVYAMGHSNGGRMVYVLWASRGDRFAAYGPSGSPVLRPLGLLKSAPFLATAGEQDPIISFDSQRRGVEALAQNEGVDLSKVAPVGYLRLGKGADGIEIGTYFFPGGHDYPREAIAATVALFKRTSR